MVINHGHTAIVSSVSGEMRASHPAQGRDRRTMADHRGSEIDHPLRDPEKIAGEDGKRDRHDLEVLDAGEELQAHGLDRHTPIVIPGGRRSRILGTAEARALRGIKRAPASWI